MEGYLILFMLLAHIIDDFYLQPGLLSDMKQRRWWRGKVPEGKEAFYKYDWIPALVIHALSWSIFLHLPVMFLYGAPLVLFVSISVVINALIHGIVDHLKCNLFKLNLVADQSIHLVQIIVTYLIVVLVWGV